MQTFLPYPDYAESAYVLDHKRLGKQRIETLQLLRAIRNANYGWQDHPATAMWRDYPNELVYYGVCICHEWLNRGNTDSVLLDLLDFATIPIVDLRILLLPPWLDARLCVSHQSNLIRKKPSYYRPLFPDVPDDLPYHWPI